MDMLDIKIECLNKKRTGMQPTMVWSDIRVTHLPTGIAVEIPHEVGRSQHCNMQVAMAMLETALVHRHVKKS